MDENSIIEQLRADAEHRSKALILIAEGIAKVEEGRALLAGGSARKARKARSPRAPGSGNGVTTEQARAYAATVRQGTPGIAREELERRVTELAVADGKSTKGLVTRLRSALQ